MQYSHRLPTLATVTKLSNSSAMSLKISKGQDEAAIRLQVNTLVESGWVVKGEIQLEKIYHLKTYTKVIVREKGPSVTAKLTSKDLHNVIAIKSKSENHHPKMLTEFSTLTVQWTTHNPRGISDKDIRMAKYSDAQAESVGTVKPSEAPRCGPASPT
ncbi:hypothetical protein BKA66DRAFT_440154 [Pyrenochaeta sp. MPI-SDFR-AT-0127]|nr:hypothetical protein BKA66DRAFT_440154 [Pyrenochaeta sp. MPI-SDFR-AT-0127]